MAMPCFSILCILQLIIGFIMFIFGIVDRTAIQVQYSFLMLPIWIGILTFISGICGILIGRDHRVKGVPNINMISCLRAINIMAIGLSFLAFYLYGLVQSQIGLQDAYNTAIENLPDDMQSKYYKMSNVQIPIDVATNMETVQGILAVIMLFCLAEILVGSWMAMTDKSLMIFGSMLQQRGPFSYQQSGPAQPQGQYQPQQQQASQGQYQPQQHQLASQGQYQPQQHQLASQGQYQPQQQQQQLHVVPQTQYIPQHKPAGPQPGQVILQPQQQPTQQPYQQPGQAVPQTQFLPQQQPTNVAQGTNDPGNQSEHQSKSNEPEHDQANFDYVKM